MLRISMAQIEKGVTLYVLIRSWVIRHIALVLWWKLNCFHSIRAGCPVYEVQWSHMLHNTQFMLSTY